MTQSGHRLCGGSSGESPVQFTQLEDSDGARSALLDEPRSLDSGRISGYIKGTEVKKPLMNAFYPKPPSQYSDPSFRGPGRFSLACKHISRCVSGERVSDYGSLSAVVVTA